MELKEYLLIIRKQMKLYMGVIVLFVLGVLGYFIFRPVTFDTSLFLNITRVGNQVSEGYKYDDFYRLQADEKFTETIVEWLKSPRIAMDISSVAGRSVDGLSLKQLTRIFQAEKMSSQIVSVKFSSADKKTAEKIAQAISDVLRKNTEKLNEDQREDTWFEIKADNPVIIENNPDLRIIFLAALAMGIFMGFWIVMLKHYLK
jgi:capsular polysaccharide biosynthesis protein